MRHNFISNLNSQKSLVLSLFIAFTFASISCQKQISFKNSKEIPKDWQKIEAEDFSFSIPSTMQRNNLRGIDSFVLQFENDEIVLDIESGIYTSNPASKLGDYEGEKELAIIDGRNIDFVSYDLNKPINLAKKTVNADGSSTLEKAERNYVFGVYFNHKYSIVPLNNGTATSFNIRSKNLEAKEIAKLIFYSIKFKQK